MENAERLQSLTARSNIKSALAILLDWAAIVLFAGISIWANYWLVYVAVVFLIGHRQYAIGECLLHQACHHNLFTRKKWHYAFEFLYALPFGTDLVAYRKEHFYHHRYLLKEQDHTTEAYEFFGLAPAKKNLFWAFWIQPFLGYATWYYAPFESHFTRKKVLLFWVLVPGIFLATGHIWYLVLYHIIPQLYAARIFLYWYEIIDHYGTRTGTRTEIGWFGNLLTHNEGYHAVHHWYPSIPWNNIRKAHEMLPHEFDHSTGIWESYKQMSNYHVAARQYRTE